MLWICFHTFELGELQLLGSTQFFTPYVGFPLLTLLLGMLHCLFFQDLKDGQVISTETAEIAESAETLLSLPN